MGSVDGARFNCEESLTAETHSFLEYGVVRVKVMMFMHPFTVVFMLFWLGAVGYGAWDAFAHPRLPGAVDSFVLPGMFLFGVSMTAGGFFPEATKAKRLLSAAILNSNVGMS